MHQAKYRVATSTLEGILLDDGSINQTGKGASLIWLDFALGRHVRKAQSSPGFPDLDAVFARLTLSPRDPDATALSRRNTGFFGEPVDKLFCFGERLPNCIDWGVDLDLVLVTSTFRRLFFHLVSFFFFDPCWAASRAASS